MVPFVSPLQVTLKVPEDQFDEQLGAQYSRCELKVMEFDKFTVRAYLAAPKPRAKAA